MAKHFSKLGTLFAVQLKRRLALFAGLICLFGCLPQTTPVLTNQLPATSLTLNVVDDPSPHSGLAVPGTTPANHEAVSTTPNAGPTTVPVPSSAAVIVNNANSSGGGSGVDPIPTPKGSPATRHVFPGRPHATVGPTNPPYVLPTPTAIEPGEPTFSGIVKADDGNGQIPLEKCFVRLSNQYVAITHPDGTFVMKGSFPTDGVFMVGHEGYVTSSVFGLTDNGATVLHLHTPSIGQGDANALVFSVSGKVVDTNGQGVADATVVFENAEGASGGPVATEADGTYVMDIYAANSTVASGTLYAGESSRLALSVGVAPVDGQALPELALNEGTHSVQFNVTNLPVGVTPDAAIDVVSADGTSLQVPRLNDTWSVVNPNLLSGAHYRVRVNAGDIDRGLESAYVSDPQVLDFQSASDLLTVNLLDVPALVPSPSISPGSLITWPAVIGNQILYRTEIRSNSNPIYNWEAVSDAHSINIPAQLPPGQISLPQGSYQLIVTALEGSNLNVRSLASLHASPRRLRVTPTTPITRRASCYRQVTL